MSVSHITTGKKLLNARELAARYGVCRRTVTNWQREGRISVIKLGRRTIRYDAERTDREIARFTVEAITTK
ncbi:MAG: helix-turn-helix domain-containing protein [Verrucomicrobiaceae bacterium]